MARTIKLEICSTAVEHTPGNVEVVTPGNVEVVGSNNAGGWAFFLLLSVSSLSHPSFLHQWSVLNQVPQKEAPLQLCVAKEI